MELIIGKTHILSESLLKAVSAQLNVSEIKSPSDTAGLTIPRDFTFFTPHLSYFVKQTIEIGGSVYASKTGGTVTGLFIWDDFEKTGTIFTRSKDAFDYFYQLKKPFDYLFAELKMDRPNEPYDIFTADLAKSPVSDHRFRHEVTVAEEKETEELERFMTVNHPGMNKKWVKVALDDGEKCFTVRLKNEIAGVGWLSVVNRVGNLHSLFVKRQYRNLGIGEDILYARLLWLKTKGATSAFSEIEQSNHSSSQVASKARMTATGHIYQYFMEGEPKVHSSLGHG